MSIFNSSVIAYKQCIPRVARALHASYLQIFSRHEVLHVFLVKLDVKCTVSIHAFVHKIYMHTYISICIHAYICSYSTANKN